MSEILQRWRIVFARDDEAWLIGTLESLLRSYKAAINLAFELDEAVGLLNKRVAELEARPAPAQPADAFKKTEGGIYVPE